MADPPKKPAKSDSPQSRPTPPAPAPPSSPQPLTPGQPFLPGIIREVAQHWSGPYPPPEAVERYEIVLPGAFDRIIAMAEQLQAAQIAQSDRALDYSYFNGRRGHLLGSLIAVLAMGGALLCASIGAPWVAGVFLSVPVMAIAKALIEAAKAPAQK